MPMGVLIAFPNAGIEGVGMFQHRDFLGCFIFADCADMFLQAFLGLGSGGDDAPFAKDVIG